MSDAEKSENQKLQRQQIILARFGELALRSDDLDKILTEACYLVGDALGVAACTYPGLGLHLSA